RKACAYLRPCPYAIVVAPTGDAAAGDVNFSAEGGFPSAVSWLVQLSQDSTGVLTLRLRRVATFGGVPTNNTLVLTGLTLQDVVDWICSSTVASAAKEWRAQLVPGAGAYVPATNLAPSHIDVAGCSNGTPSTTLTVSSTADLAEGMLINDVAWAAGTYIKTKVNATTLTMSQNSIGASGPARIMEFYCETSDTNFFTDATAHSQFGNMLSIGNACPVVLAFKESYLAGFPTDKRDWMITAGGATDRPYGANIYHSSPGCRRTVESDAGIFMGGAPLKRGCIIFCSNWIGYVVNSSQNATGEDVDYRTIWLDKGHGCKSPYSIVFGNNWAGCWRDDGFWITDGERSAVISEAHFRLNEGVGVGELAYEALQCNNAAAADTDDYYMHASYDGGVLRLNYRVSAGVFATVSYDATLAIEKMGIAQMLRQDGSPFGWSTRCSYSWRSFAAGCGGAMGAVRKSDGLHLYQCDDKNDKTRGGLLQEFESTGAYLDGADPVVWDLYGPTDMAGKLRKSCLAGPITLLYKNTVSSGASGVTGTIYRNQARTASSTIAIPITPTTDIFTRKVVNTPLATRSPSELQELRLHGGALAAEQVFEITGGMFPVDTLDLVT
ncbi:MAG TPA: hypothetical protein VN903_28435, partial [Polyangia bacterium]|nr:hypothetical protein [Polyangia bacterium]